MDKENILKLAIAQAKKVIVSDRKKDKYRLGAVLFSKNRILNVGNNKFGKTHPLSPSPYKAFHAEFDAILGVPRDELEGSSLCIVRLGARNNLTMSRPCAFCAKFLEQSGIKKVYWTDFSGMINLSKF